MRTFFVVRNRVELDSSISRIFLSLDDFAIFKQFKCEGILCKLFSFQTFSELELSLRSSRCEDIVELCVCWKWVSCFKNVTFFSNSDRYFSFHWVISHSCFRTLNFFYSILVSTNLCIVKSQIIKGYNTLFRIGLGLKNSSFWIFQLESELTSFQLTTCKCLSKVKLSFNWSYNVVVEDFIVSTWFESTFGTIFSRSY